MVLLHLVPKVDEVERPFKTDLNRTLPVNPLERLGDLHALATGLRSRQVFLRGTYLFLDL